MNVICSLILLLGLAPKTFAMSSNKLLQHLYTPPLQTEQIGKVNYFATLAGYPSIMMEIAPADSKAPPLNVIEGEITDPNFNTMRNQESKKSTAIAWVFGCLIVATIVPLATWWYFSG